MNNKPMRWEDIATIPGKCAVCSLPAMLDPFGNSITGCKRCAWVQCRSCIENPGQNRPQNLVSLNKARQLYKENKLLKPNFEEFIEAYINYKEMEFWYKNKRRKYNENRRNFKIANFPHARKKS